MYKLIVLIINKAVMIKVNLFFRHSVKTAHLAMNPAKGGTPAKFRVTVKYIHFFLFSKGSIEIFLFLTLLIGIS